MIFEEVVFVGHKAADTAQKRLVNHDWIFSRDEATLYEGVSVRPSVGPSIGPSVGWPVTSSFFGLLGATNAVYTALF